MPASAALDAFIDESIGVSVAHGYTPTTFQRMRRDYGTLEAMERLVKSGDIQSGFKRLKQLGLLQWTIEAAILRFPDEFTRDARECAQWRLEQAQAEAD